MKIQHLKNFRDALAEVDQEIDKQKQLYDMQRQVLNAIGDEIIRLGENRDALLTLIASFEESVDSPVDELQVQVEPEVSAEDVDKLEADQPVKAKPPKHRPSGIGLNFFKAAFRDDTLPEKIEEILEKTGSGWREKQILWGTVKVDGKNKPLHRPYHVDLVDPDSRLRTMLARDWLLLMRAEDNPNPIEVERVITVIRQHPSTPNERRAAITRWGLSQNT